MVKNITGANFQGQDSDWASFLTLLTISEIDRETTLETRGRMLPMIAKRANSQRVLKAIPGTVPGQGR